MSVSVGAIGAVNSGQSLYSVLSPYLNGVVRTSDAAALAQVNATEQTTSAAATQAAIAARGDATAAATAAPPFANPAITSIGERLALGQALSSTTSITPDALLSPTTLHADGSSSTAASTANLTTLATFNAIDTTNSIATLNSLAAFNATDTTTTPVAATTTPDQISAANSALTGDSGTLIQSYGAVALLAGVQAAPSIYGLAATPVIPATAVVSPVPSVSKVAA